MPTEEAGQRHFPGRTAIKHSHDALTSQMLEWIAQGAHPYTQVEDVWKSSRPRLTIWEDACAEGLLDAGPGRFGVVSLTEKGKTFLSHHRL